MYTIYILQSLARNYIYVGMTNNIERRLGQHQQGKAKTTKAYRPFKLIFTEERNTRQEARNREKYLKSGIGKEWIKSVVLKRQAT
ncbi:MAG: GIY-YIG nuclease family protein [bacterium]|nr:GIY-YIG nuclease family protein [bacterium]